MSRGRFAGPLPMGARGRPPVSIRQAQPEDVPVLADAIETARDRFHDADPAAIAATVRSRFSREEIGAQFSRLYRAVTRDASGRHASR